VSRPLPAISRRWMSIALLAMVLIAVGFAIWG
jgi:hypothetical protein